MYCCSCWLDSRDWKCYQRIDPKDRFWHCRVQGWPWMYCWNGTGSAFSHTLGPTFQVVCAYSQTLGEGGYVYPVRGWLECMDSLRRLKKWHHRLWHALLQSGLNSVQSIEYLPNGSTWQGLMDEYLVFAGKYRPNVLPTRENRSLYRIDQFRRSITKRNELLQLHTAISSIGRV